MFSSTSRAYGNLTYSGHMQKSHKGYITNAVLPQTEQPKKLIYKTLYKSGTKSSGNGQSPF